MENINVGVPFQPMLFFMCWFEENKLLSILDSFIQITYGKMKVEKAHLRLKMPSPGTLPHIQGLWICHFNGEFKDGVCN